VSNRPGSRAHAGVATAALLFAAPALAQDHATAEAGKNSGTAAFPKGQYGTLDALPDWGGIWFLNRRPTGEAPSSPRLKGEYLVRFEQWQRDVAASEGVTRRSRSNCSPPGMPRIMQLAQYPYEFLFTPGRVTINQEAWMQTRTIWTDGRAHDSEPDPTFMGDSVGRWEDGTLVIETRAILEELEFANGALHSPEFRVTERIALSEDNPDILVNRLRMEDPQALAEPFEVTLTYRRDRQGRLLEFQCSENDRNPVNTAGETQFD
jgi:hypothetical protein